MEWDMNVEPAGRQGLQANCVRLKVYGDKVLIALAPLPPQLTPLSQKLEPRRSV